jgi:hypothetical protein
MNDVSPEPFTPDEKREAVFLCELLKSVLPHLRAMRSKMVILSEPGTRPAIALNSDAEFVRIDWADDSEYLEVMEVIRACPDLRVVLDRIEEALSEVDSRAAVTVRRAKATLGPRGVPPAP